MKFILSTSLFAVALAGGPEDGEGSQECLADYAKMTECAGKIDNHKACEKEADDTLKAALGGSSPTEAQRCDGMKAAIACYPGCFTLTLLADDCYGGQIDIPTGCDVLSESSTLIGCVVGLLFKMHNAIHKVLLLCEMPPTQTHFFFLSTRLFALSQAWPRSRSRRISVSPIR